MNALAVFNFDAVKRNEEVIYKLVADAVAALCRQGWTASAQRFWPPDEPRAGGHPGYVLGLRVEVDFDDGRIDWQPFRGRPSEAGKRFEGSYPAGFEWSPGSEGRVMLLSGIETGSGAEISRFISRLNDGTVEHQASVRSDRPRGG